MTRRSAVLLLEPTLNVNYALAKGASYSRGG